MCTILPLISSFHSCATIPADARALKINFGRRAKHLSRAKSLAFLPGVQRARPNKFRVGATAVTDPGACTVRRRRAFQRVPRPADRFPLQRWRHSCRWCPSREFCSSPGCRPSVTWCCECVCACVQRETADAAV